MGLRCERSVFRSLKKQNERNATYFVTTASHCLGIAAKWAANWISLLTMAYRQRMDPSTSEPEYVVNPRGASKRIILMDLNVALSENFSDMKNYGFVAFITFNEKFRQWLIDLLRDEYVIVITARDTRWKEATLRRILEVSGWNPQEALFNDTGIPGGEAPRIKKTLMEKYVFPKHGEAADYLAIESNSNTRRMYAKLGVTAIDCKREGFWTEIPKG